MSDESSTRTALELGQVRRDLDTLLKIVRDGNGTAALINRMQSVEKDLTHLVVRDSEAKQELEKLKAQHLELSKMLIEVSHSTTGLSQNFDKFVLDFRASEDARDKARIKRSDLIWGAISAVVCSIVVNYLLNHKVVPANQPAPSTTAESRAK